MSKKKKAWICSRCTRDVAVGRVLGTRARFAHERCPLCTNPGSNMEYVDVPESKAGEKGESR